MDRLTPSLEVKEAETKKQEQSAEQQVVVDATPPINAYVESFEGQTIADIKRQEEEKQHQEFLVEKEKLIQQQFEEKKELKQEKAEEKQEIKQETKQEEKKSVNIIEKPNYDLIEEPKKTIKLKRKEKQKTEKKPNKLASIVLACALGICTVISIVNFSVLDQMENNISNLEQTYNLRIDKYIKNILNLDTTKKSMEFIETYPDELLDAGELGKKSNWFDRLCNFLGGLFGG